MTLYPSTTLHPSTGLYPSAPPPALALNDARAVPTAPRPLLTQRSTLAVAAAAAAATVNQPQILFAPVRYNRNPNPAAAQTLTGWTVVGGALARVTDLPASWDRSTGATGTGNGSTYLDVRAATYLSPTALDGQQWSASVQWSISTVPTNGVVLLMVFLDSAGATLTFPAVSVPAASITAGTPQRTSIVATAPAGAQRLLVIVRTNTTTYPSGQTLTATAARYEQGSLPGLPYGDGDTDGWQWDDVAGTSTSTRPDASVQARYNRSRNPSCDTVTTDWAGSGTVTRLTGQTIADTGKTTCGAVAVTTAAGTQYLAAGGAATSTAGQQWTVVGWALCTVARTVRPSVSTWNGATLVATVATQTDIAMPANTWTRVRFQFTTPTGTYTQVRLHALLPTTGSAGTLRMGAVRFEQGRYPELDFADGSSGGRWAWDGTAGASTSTQAAPIVVRAYGTRTTPTTTSALLAQRHPIAVAASRSSSVATRPLLAHRQALTVTATRAAPSASTALLAQTQTVSVRSVRSASSATEVVLGLALRNARSATTVARPLLTQRSTLQARSVFATATTTRPTSGQRSTLVVRPAAAQAVTLRALLGQRTPITVRAVRAISTATRPEIRFRVGKPVIVPTAVVVATRQGHLDIKHRQGHTNVPNRDADVAVDVGGKIVVVEQYGTVLETVQ